MTATPDETASGSAGAKAWLWLAAAIGCDVGATLALRAATDHPAWFAAVAVGYVVSFACLVGVLRRGMAIGVAYGIWGAAGVTLTALAARAIFDEPLTWVMGLGFLAIVAGVVLVENGKPADSEAVRMP